MTEYDRKRIDDLVVLVKSLIDANQNLQAQLRLESSQHQETRNILEKLAAIQDLEWSLDLKDFVSKAKLEALRREPR